MILNKFVALATVKIILADPQFVTRMGIKNVLSQVSDFQIIFEAKNSAELLEEIKVSPPNVIIIDYNSGCFQVDDLKKVKMLSPKSTVMVISSDHNKNNIHKVLDFGIKNFITKECDSDEIIQAVYATSKGENFFCAKVIDIILEKHFTNKDGHCEPSELSKRETEIVQLIAQGFTGKQIADKLFLSHHTISTHRKNILKKLHINSTSELILYAIRLGIVSQPQN
ncbi:MAG TPA: response regulator transcription factor [Bacteroidia bacterium]|jgi:DNA-binding NarL/FixJ family response regulator|nr:response regulator transcription factor [Bacteroidia bacterium]